MERSDPTHKAAADAAPAKAEPAKPAADGAAVADGAVPAPDGATPPVRDPIVLETVRFEPVERDEDSTTRPLTRDDAGEERLLHEASPDSKPAMSEHRWEDVPEDVLVPAWPQPRDLASEDAGPAPMSSSAPPVDVAAAAPPVRDDPPGERFAPYAPPPPLEPPAAQPVAAAPIPAEPEPVAFEPPAAAPPAEPLAWNPAADAIAPPAPAPPLEPPAAEPVSVAPIPAEPEPVALEPGAVAPPAKPLAWNPAADAIVPLAPAPWIEPPAAEPVSVAPIPAEPEPVTFEPGAAAPPAERLAWNPAADAIVPPAPAPRPSEVPAREVTRFKDLAQRALRVAAIVFGGWVSAVLVLIVVFRFVNPPASTLMILQWISGTPIQHEWVPLERISPNLRRAVIVAEDGRFCDHWGVDFVEVAKAIERANDGYPRGASTITMQVAKNLFLLPVKSYLRKVVEVPLTFAIELVWPKWRILEVYLNIAEWGPGVFGAEAAAQAHFGRPAAGLSARQAAQLAVVLPNPIARDAGSPGPRTAHRASVI